MKGSVSVHTVEVLARSDNSCKFMSLTNTRMRFLLLSMNLLRSCQETSQVFFFISVNQLSNFIVYVNDEPMADPSKVCFTETGTVRYFILVYIVDIILSLTLWKTRMREYRATMEEEIIT